MMSFFWYDIANVSDHDHLVKFTNYSKRNRSVYYSNEKFQAKLSKLCLRQALSGIKCN